MEVCEHLVHAMETPRIVPADGCEECLRVGGWWVHLRQCMTCGRVGCCDESPNRHATAHFEASEHPVIRSIEPEETWLWCFKDEAGAEPA
jgi:uncharacterized UBP type Zn finger protein